jgi:FdhD protein
MASAQDLVAVEEPLQLSLGDKDLVVTMRTPGHDIELAVGFLVSEGIVRGPDQIDSVVSDDKGTVRVHLVDGADVDCTHAIRNFYMTSACGVCGRTSIDSLLQRNRPYIRRDLPRVNANLISSLPERMRCAQPVFDRTGGLHAAGLFTTDGDLLLSREDVGRHNAVDKLVGAAYLKNLLPLADHILFLSGRISFELVQKALAAGIPIITAVGAPSSLAVQTARRFGITLAGFLRDQRFHIYAGARRLT